MSKPELKVSFEFFPPKQEASDNFWKVITKLEEMKPHFVSVTYGAGGTTQERTLGTVNAIRERTSLIPAAHLTCVGAPREDVDKVVRGYWEAGIRHIVALRGDPPGGVGGRFVPHPEGYRNAADLVRGIREIAPFEISVSAYPEKHPEAVSIEEDLAFLADKAEHGATRALSQFFFNNAAFLRFRDRVFARGIDIELVPGILPITNFARVKEFAAKCGAFLPPALAQRFHGLDQDPETRNLVAAMVAAEQVDFLRREGVNSFHFYTLNRADLVYAICRVVGLGEQAEAA
ncbi:methylenetetrahydrofolate reductase [NAD(P)H] [Aestuariivirga sp. YIM B02566]|uniref:Methylenetetrahydrofolate reductase [NAD(P)H] n=1 Tax=Taklimakanibacter albus TaxID=2800327 RepID=A0ACC5QYQ7_9HYPH|nr:methylenetetrahydrofolate reductase [NAD(P)H] [Aestuariivirga sp. YIM B02566]MBK1865492.1 methylenetetrahydrofolate reductase [NAD(P)H] [Aestuariivirga sp. YIM B02566]